MILSFLIQIFVAAIVVMLGTWLIPRVEVRNFGSALLVAFLLGILNPTLGVILRTFFHMATLGIFFLTGLDFLVRLIASAIILILIDKVYSGFRVRGFGYAILLALNIAIITTLVNYWFLS
jgi:putative membrane protein